MAYATRNYGFRVITVAGVRCRRRVRYGEQDAILTLQSATTKGGQQALVILPGYLNPWSDFSNPVSRLIVAPAMVKQVIERALALGWQPEERVPALVFDFHPESARGT